MGKNDLDLLVKKTIHDNLKNYKVKICEEVLEEISDIFSRNGKKQKFISKLTTCLGQLDKVGEKIYASSDTRFEELKHIEEMKLYSMHIDCGVNFRILHTIYGNNLIVLLAGFDERAGKRKTDYSSHIVDAINRYNKI